MSPKPTIFLPSVAETNLRKTGTYLCLLEKFFPDVIKVYWTEKGSSTILESQEGATVKTNDTYMKFSWLTVPEDSLKNEHICIVQHESNKKGVDQEVVFPPIDIVATTINPTLAVSKSEDDVRQLQLTNTSACYTYVLLLLKSFTYSAFIAVCLFRRTAICGDEKSSS